MNTKLILALAGGVGLLWWFTQRAANAAPAPAPPGGGSPAPVKPSYWVSPPYPSFPPSWWLSSHNGAYVLVHHPLLQPVDQNTWLEPAVIAEWLQGGWFIVP